tara:strand:+ start:609 stop:1079 length:471 start_codon:yes stop_codon:yes gene_type:complete
LALKAGAFGLLIFILLFFQTSQAHTFSSVSDLNDLWIVTKNNKHKFRVELAKTASDQQTGLMFRRNLAADQGMLFVKSYFSIIQMWMKNTYISLDMIFIGRQGKIVDIYEKAVPHSNKIIRSKSMAVAVLEVNGGTVSRLNINIGDTIVFPDLEIK